MHRPAVDRALAAVHRDDRARIVAALVRRFGFDIAEESFEAAIEQAITRWSVEGVARDPAGWLRSVAWRRAIDRVRRMVIDRDARGQLAHTIEPSSGAEPTSIEDDRLRLLFTCCHPAIARESQVALALRWLSGLSTSEVARAFCVAESAMAQRLTRAKSKIAAARIPYEIPAEDELHERIAAVLEVIYAIFNEGYVATEGPELSRVELADEAIYLGATLVQLVPESADARAMLSLMLLVHARRDARHAGEQGMIALDEQDRARWDQPMIARGTALLREALARGRPSAYAIEAAIQALHDESPSYAQTDFAQIVELYALLRAKMDHPLIELNEAVARSMIDGPEPALRALAAIERRGALAEHHALYAAKADLLRRCGRVREAQRAYDRAIERTRNEAEQRFLLRRRAALGPDARS